jgi:hypothetical protein
MLFKTLPGIVFKRYHEEKSRWKKIHGSFLLELEKLLG